eukprot:1768152-Pleurochrysis_carterae.AAC.1
MELFVSKIVLMMLVLLCFSAILDRVENTDMLYNHQLSNLISVADLTSTTSDVFNASLSVYTACAPDDSFGLYWPEPCLIYAKIDGEVVYPRDGYLGSPYAPGTTYDEVMDSRRDTIELFYVQGDPQVCNIDGTGRADQARDDERCPTVMVYDMKLRREAEIESQIWLTLVIVFDLVLGMLLIAADMQRLLLNPLERLTKVIKIMTGRHWRKRLDTKGGECEGKGAKKKPKKKPKAGAKGRSDDDDGAPRSMQPAEL